VLLSGYVSACQDLLSRRAADRIHAVTGNCRRKTFLFHRFFFCYYWGIFIKRSFFPSPPVWYLSMTALAGQTLAHPGVGPRVASGLRQLPLQVSPGQQNHHISLSSLGSLVGNGISRPQSGCPWTPMPWGRLLFLVLCVHTPGHAVLFLCAETHT